MKKVFIFLIAIILLLGASVPVYADSKFVPYEAYEYNSESESVSAPIGYLPESRIYSDDMSLSLALNNPTDMFFDGNDTVYILDSGNSRILLADKDLKVKGIIDKFYSSENPNEMIDFNGAQGFAADNNGNFYIADTKNNRILISTYNGEVTKIITRPDEALQSVDSPFDVTKILVDKKGKIYAIAQSINLGAMVFTPDGEFSSFFGSNEVSTTADVILNYFKRKFMTKEQIAGMQKVTPITFSNFCIDDGGFIYTVTGSSDEEKTVRCLNFSGEDILNKSDKNKFGDLEWDRKLSEESIKTSFQDIYVDSSGFINLLDTARGRIFQYSSDGRLLTVFGNYGDQIGSFVSPCAIMELGENVLVLDNLENCIHIFKPTVYIKDVRAAVNQLHNYEFQNSLDSWEKILRKNTNSTFPYYGMGLTYDAKGDYVQAMKYFKLADEHELYSNSFEQYRKSYLQTHYLQIIGLAIIVIAIASALFWLIKKKMSKTELSGMEYCENNKYFYPFYTLFHPVSGFEELKTNKKGSYLTITGIIGIWFLIETLAFFKTGFVFNTYRAADYNFIITLFQTLGAFMLFAISNWAISTLFDGKGRFKEIMSVTAYSLIPLLVSELINVLLSNVLVESEGAFMSIISILGIAWAAIIFFLGLYSIHQYSVSGTFFSIIASVIGMILLIFLGIVFYTLIQQLVDFISSLSDEISLR